MAQAFTCGGWTVTIETDGSVHIVPPDSPKSLALDRAVSAMHTQNRPDGKPSRFKPTLE